MQVSVTKKITQSVLQQCKLYDFLSYRTLLRSLYLSTKHNVKLISKQRGKAVPYSYLVFAQDLGLSRSNVLRLVLSGERSLTPRATKKIIQALGMSRSEAQYFESLVGYNNAKTASEKDKNFAKIVQIRKNHGDTSQVDPRVMMYFSNWYHPVIRELVLTHASGLTAEDIQDRLIVKLRIEEIRNSLSLLVELGYLKKVGDRSFVSDDETWVQTGHEVDHVAMTGYHAAMMDRAKASLIDVHQDMREIQALTLSLSHEQVKEYKEFIYRFVQSAMDKEKARKSENQTKNIYQLNVQLFPFTKEIREKKNDDQD